jgi:hypothetical protein
MYTANNGTTLERKNKIEFEKTSSFVFFVFTQNNS